MVAAGVGFVAGIGLGYVVTLPCQTDTRERLPPVFGGIGGIANVMLAIYWFYF